MEIRPLKGLEYDGYDGLKSGDGKYVAIIVETMRDAEIFAKSFINTQRSLFNDVNVHKVQAGTWWHIRCARRRVGDEADDAYDFAVFSKGVLTPEMLRVIQSAYDVLYMCDCEFEDFVKFMEPHTYAPVDFLLSFYRREKQDACSKSLDEFFDEFEEV